MALENSNSNDQRENLEKKIDQSRTDVDNLKPYEKLKLTEELRNKNLQENTREEKDIYVISKDLRENHSILWRKINSEFRSEIGKIRTDLRKNRTNLYEKYDVREKASFKRDMTQAEERFDNAFRVLNRYWIPNTQWNLNSSSWNFYQDLKVQKSLFQESSSFYINRLNDNYSNDSEASILIKNINERRNFLLDQLNSVIQTLEEQQKLQPKPIVEKEKPVYIQEDLEISVDEKDQKKWETEKISSENIKIVSEYIKKHNNTIDYYTISGRADGHNFQKWWKWEKKVMDNYQELKLRADTNKIDVPKVDESMPNEILARNRAVSFLRDMDISTLNTIKEKWIKRDISTTKEKDIQWTYRFWSIQAEFKKDFEIISEIEGVPKYLNDVFLQNPWQDQLHGHTKYLVNLSWTKLWRQQLWQVSSFLWSVNNDRYINQGKENWEKSNETETLWREWDNQADLDYLLLKIFSWKQKIPLTGSNLEWDPNYYKWEKVKSVIQQAQWYIDWIQSWKYSSVQILNRIFERNNIGTPGYDYSYVKIPWEK